jgi:acrylyl-CoA reductase (NADPH)
MTEIRALVAQRSGDEVHVGVFELDPSELGDGEVLVRVDWSDINYKDALATLPKGGVARLDRLVPGIDLAGVVEESGSPDFPEGSSVIAHGYGIGVSHNGGFATHARVPAQWVVPLPQGLTSREAMIVGTAGFTAAMSVEALIAHEVTPGKGPVLVTGATGGVGSFAVAMLSHLGYEVVASTGKQSEESWLRSLGASDVIAREELTRPGKALESQRWSAAVDSVGGATLAGVLRAVRTAGVVAASGLTGGSQLETTVFPFILRGVALLGMDSAEYPIGDRRALWQQIAGDWRPSDLDGFVFGEVGLDGVPAAIDAVLGGATRGRWIVRLR